MNQAVPPPYKNNRPRVFSSNNKNDTYERYMVSGKKYIFKVTITVRSIDVTVLQ